ncbi:MAG: hypothetical protein D3917_12675 [Candidatus Electrothrix sp. AX5]|nr:hypothetical protein [Candidatus Electrothrix sp. AX5]
MNKTLAKMSVCGMTTALLAVGLVNGLRADVILDEPNLVGSVGLTGETFGSGSVNVSWSGGSVSNPLTSGDTEYALRADIEKPLTLRAYMYSFADSGARLYQYINGIPALGDTEKRTLNLARNSGRIRGIVNVTGNSGNEGVTYMKMYSSAQPSSTESYSGYVTATTAAPVQPMPALSNTNVYGSAVLRKAKAGGECSITVSLPTQSVTVPDVNGIVDAIWPIDMTQLTCPVIEPPKTGSLQGNVTLSGLDGLNSDAFYSQRVGVHANGRGYSSNTITTTSGSYLISAIHVGNYTPRLISSLKSPYDTYLHFYLSNVSVVEGGTTHTHQANKYVANHSFTVYSHMLLYQYLFYQITQKGSICITS